MPRVTPSQIIEAALFVGGTSLTIKRLCALLKGEFDQHFVEDTIDGLNKLYAAENRPYEIRFGTGGYRMELRDSFEAVRNRVFGFGPKEVKLNQDALEVLSLVAYGIGAGVTPTCLFALPSVLRGPAGAARAFGALMNGRNLGVLVGPVLFAAASKSAGGWHAAVPLFAAGTTLAVVAALCLFPMLTPRATGESAQGTRR